MRSLLVGGAAGAIRETSNYSNIKVQFALKASLTSMSEKASHLQKFVHLAFKIEIVSFSFAWLTVICQLTILSNLDGLLIKFSINCDLNKVVKLSYYCIYKSTASWGHFWMQWWHVWTYWIQMMISVLRIHLKTHSGEKYKNTQLQWCYVWRDQIPIFQQQKNGTLSISNMIIHIGSSVDHQLVIG